MSTFGPLDHYPGVLERKPGFIDLQVQMRDRPEVTGAVLYGSWHFNHLYGLRTGSSMGGAAVAADNDQRSLLLAAVVRPDGGASRRSVAISDRLRYGRASNFTSGEVTRGTLRYLFDLGDYATIVGGKKVLPADDQMLYVAINQTRPTLPLTGAGYPQVVAKGAVDTGDLILGPILPIPPTPWWSIAEPTLVLSGEAPSTGAGTVAMGAASTFPNPSPDIQWPGPLHFVLPRPTTSYTIRNTEDALGSSLRVSHGLGEQVYELTPGTGRTFFGSVKEICLMSAAAAATCAFTIEADINLGGAAGGV